jgi:archaellin
LVLVAAIAAAVIINTTEQIQQKAQKAGRDTAHDIGIGLLIKCVVGQIDPTINRITKLRIWVELNPGAESIDLETVMLTITTSNSRDENGLSLDISKNLIHAYRTTPADGVHYFIYEEGDDPAGLDPNNAYQPTAKKYWLDQDAILIAVTHLDLMDDPATAQKEGPLSTASYCTLKFIPAGGGSMGICSFRVPGSFGDATWIDLSG